MVNYEEYHLLVHNAVLSFERQLTLQRSNACTFNHALLAARCNVGVLSAYSFTLRVEATCSPQMSVGFQQTIWHYISGNRTHHIWYVLLVLPVMLILLCCKPCDIHFVIYIHIDFNEQLFSMNDNSDSYFGNNQFESRILHKLSRQVSCWYSQSQ